MTHTFRASIGCWNSQHSSIMANVRNHFSSLKTRKFFIPAKFVQDISHARVVRRLDDHIRYFAIKSTNIPYRSYSTVTELFTNDILLTRKGHLELRVQHSVTTIDFSLHGEQDKSESFCLKRVK